jgi:hypothetical protein
MIFVNNHISMPKTKEKGIPEIFNKGSRPLVLKFVPGTNLTNKSIINKK